MIHFCAVLIFIGISKADLVKRDVRPQNPPVWDALDVLKGNNRGLTTEQIQEIYINARPGEDFPALSVIPPNNIDCASFNQPGFYADSQGYCQVFHRCDINGNLTSYLCPNMTLFNQITLVCDWFWNVDCARSKAFADYSNSRLYQGEEVHLLDDQMVQQASGAVMSTNYGPLQRVQKQGNRPQQNGQLSSDDTAEGNYHPANQKSGPPPVSSGYMAKIRVGAKENSLQNDQLSIAGESERAEGQYQKTRKEPVRAAPGYMPEARVKLHRKKGKY